jgi:hypothetical protein
VRQDGAQPEGKGQPSRAERLREAEAEQEVALEALVKDIMAHAEQRPRSTALDQAYSDASDSGSHEPASAQHLRSPYDPQNALGINGADRCAPSLLFAWYD